MTYKTQALMDQAYDRWQAFEPKMNREDFWDTLSADERKAVFVGNFNYQVTNGGFSQWHDNGYATTEVVTFLQRLCKRLNTAASLDVDCLLAEFATSIEEFDPTARGMNGEYDEEAIEEWMQEVDKLADRYYKINDQFLADVEASL